MCVFVFVRELVFRSAKYLALYYTGESVNSAAEWDREMTERVY